MNGGGRGIRTPGTLSGTAVLRPPVSTAHTSLRVRNINSLAARENRRLGSLWGLLWGLLLLKLREQLRNIELLKLLHGVALVFWCGMHITHSRGDAGMPHEFLQSGKINSGHCRTRTKSVAKIIEPEFRLDTRIAYGVVMASDRLA